MIKFIKFWFNYWQLANSRHPSWQVTYDDGNKTWPLVRDTADAQMRMFGGTKRYVRDHNGDLISGWFGNGNR